MAQLHTTTKSSARDPSHVGQIPQSTANTADPMPTAKKARKTRMSGSKWPLKCTHAEFMDWMRSRQAEGPQAPERIAIRGLLAILMASRRGLFSLTESLHMTSQTFENDRGTYNDGQLTAASLPIERMCTRAGYAKSRPSLLLKLPLEINTYILEQLDSLVDVYSTVQAARTFRDAFKRASGDIIERLLPRMTWAPTEEDHPEIMQYCRHQKLGEKTIHDDDIRPQSANQRAYNYLALTVLVIDAIDVCTQSAMQDLIYSSRCMSRKSLHIFVRALETMEHPLAVRKRAKVNWDRLTELLTTEGTLQELYENKDWQDMDRQTRITNGDQRDEADEFFHASFQWEDVELQMARVGFLVDCLSKTTMCMERSGGAPAGTNGLSKAMEGIILAVAVRMKETRDEIWQWGLDNLPTMTRPLCEQQGEETTDLEQLPRRRGKTILQIQKDVAETKQKLTFLKEGDTIGGFSGRLSEWHV